MTEVLQANEVLTAAITVRASPEVVYAVVSDVTRIPQWSPECVRCEWLDEVHFKGWNRRRFGRWSTVSRVKVADPGREFSFIVRAMGGDFTQWSYRVEPGHEPGTTRLSEDMRMCVKLPLGALLYERFFLRVRDRRADLQDNLERSLRQVQALIEGTSR